MSGVQAVPAGGPARTKVAVLGGGLGGLAAAWTLTAPELCDRYEVTVYERSGRLGGKCSSGRGGTGPRGRPIEEHGLHLWFGFYANAFRMLRDAYAVTNRATGEDWWKSAFQKCDAVTLYDGVDEHGQAKPPDEWVGLRIAMPRDDRPPPTRDEPLHPMRFVARSARILRWIRAETVAFDTAPTPDAHGAAAAAFGRRRRAWRQFRDDSEHLFEAMVVGLAADRGKVPDDIDFRVWLRAYGADEPALMRSPILRALYDLTFAYEGGDRSRPNLAAGRAVHALLSMIGYEGAFMWRMRAGMGEVVVAPLFCALRERGVKFVFDTKVTGLGVSEDDAIKTITMTRPAAATGAPTVDRERLEQIGNWVCWSAEPDRGGGCVEGAPGPTQEVRLSRGSDFDAVVLAIPVGAFEPITTELAARSAPFAQMLESTATATAKVGTVATKSVQLWLTRPVSELCAAKVGEDGLDPAATAYDAPFDTYCDMSHLLGAEDWPEADQRPKGIVYFCAVLEGDDATDEDVREQARRFLEDGGARAFLPGAYPSGPFDWEVLFDPKRRTGAARLEAQYVRANVDASDRYARTPAAGLGRRLAPWNSGFTNLALAGDWTLTEIGGGCVEAAVTSGMEAAKWIIASGPSGVPPSMPPLEPTPARVTSLPGYVKFGPLATVPPPIEFDEMLLYAFVARADRTRLQLLCDLVLNAPTGDDRCYTAPLDHVLVAFCRFAGAHPTAERYGELGKADYHEASVWVPVVHNGEWRLFMPYVWLDDPMGIATGREVYGFPKTAGTIEGLDGPIPADRHLYAPPAFRLFAHGPSGPCAERDARASFQELLSVTTSGPENRLLAHLARLVHAHKPLKSKPHHDLGSIMDDTLRIAAGAMQLAHHRSSTLEALRSGTIGHVMLKQIRDAEVPERAALQQIIEAESQVKGDQPWHVWRLRKSTLTIAPGPGADLMATLGITSGQKVHGFGTRLGFTLGAGRIVWPPPG